LLKEEVLSVVAKYHRRGYTQQQIREKLKSDVKLEVSVPMVCNYVKEIRKRYAATTQETHAALVAEKVEQFNEVIREAWDAYERSKEDVQKRHVKRDLRKVPKDAPVEKVRSKNTRFKSTEQEIEEILKVVQVMTMREGRLPANEFLLTIIRAHELQMKLLGVLDSSTVNNNTVNVLNVDWAAMAERSPIVDPMERLPIEVKALPQPSTNGHSDQPS